MLDAETRADAGIEDEVGEEGDLISQMADMSIRSTAQQNPDKEIKNTVLNLSNPVFQSKQESSKIITVIEQLKEIQKRNVDAEVLEKAVIVSQWTSMLDIVEKHVKAIGMKCTAINGKIK